MLILTQGEVVIKVGVKLDKNIRRKNATICKKISADNSENKVEVAMILRQITSSKKEEVTIHYFLQHIHIHQLLLDFIWQIGIFLLSNSDI